MNNTIFRVVDDRDNIFDATNYEEAYRKFEEWKNIYLGEGVDGDSYIEIISSVDEDFNEYEVIKKVIPVLDKAKMLENTPKEAGFGEWDYWAKWKEA